MQIGIEAVAFRVLGFQFVVHSRGARKRRSLPTGGSAYGMPRKYRRPWASTFPWSRPNGNHAYVSWSNALNSARSDAMKTCCISNEEKCGGLATGSLTWFPVAIRSVRSPRRRPRDRVRRLGATYMYMSERSDTQGKCDIHRTVSHLSRAPRRRWLTRRSRESVRQETKRRASSQSALPPLARALARGPRKRTGTA